MSFIRDFMLLKLPRYKVIKTYRTCIIDTSRGACGSKKGLILRPVPTVNDKN